ncbi:MAG: hypothetical protein GX775_03175 [Erysipelothrix sp.]|nr:hypothetical protein [Erysipelothrix sp.]
MKKKIEKLCELIFSIGLLLALAGSVIVFLLLVASLIIGSESLAVFASGKLMPIFIQISAVALGGGLISMYVSGEHELTID